MEFRKIRYLFSASVLVSALLLSGCHSGYSVASVEGRKIAITSALDVNPDPTTTVLLNRYKMKVDSIMSPVIGHSTSAMRPFRPESELSNLAADILRFSTIDYIGTVADVGVTNMGGLRNALPQGEIRYGDIYEITPFENTLCIVTLDGKLLRELFENIAKVHGEGLSGARLVISEEGDLLSATVGGTEIDENRQYKVATVDYLAEGNDRMHAFAKVPESHKIYPEGAILRQLFLNYVMAQTKAGKEIDSRIEGRITINNKSK